MPDTLPCYQANLNIGSFVRLAPVTDGDDIYASSSFRAERANVMTKSAIQLALLMQAFLD